jgi:ATP-dependent exoDNAse (exonuclease V) alpha subunit
VIALAPSAAAAAQLALSLRIGADTVAKWIHASDPATAGSDPWRFRAGQLVLIDEAAMASTNHLDRIASQATAAGAKVVLIGDHCQLGAVDAGGAFALLAGEGHAVELDQLHRFTEDWESAATRQLRVGDPTCLDAYANHDRLHDGPAEAMAETAYRAWAADLSVGRHSLLLAADNATVSTLNARARADQVRNGTVHTDRAVALHDGTAAGRGDVVLTRRNERRLHRPDGGHVRNGDRWQVDAVHADGALDVVPAGSDGASFRGVIRLPADYVRAHVELGYALTVHRAQGATAETTHLVADARMSREALYVGLTRGRHANHVYVATDAPETEIHARGEVPTGRQVLEAVLRSPASERSATSVLRQRQAEHVLALSRAGQWPPPVDESRRRDLSTDPRRQPPSRELSW